MSKYLHEYSSGKKHVSYNKIKFQIAKSNFLKERRLSIMGGRDGLSMGLYVFRDVS